MMKAISLRTEDGRVVCERCLVADNALTRMRGLLGRTGLEPGEGLLIRPAGSIHTFFMRFPIDAIFLDRQHRVRRVLVGLRPWRVSPIVFGARSVVELPAGTLVDRGLEGRQLRIE